jgi:BirA family biotin operon repressor/biotin-[acetyl-CoA-carboxylase] ligase
MGGGATSTGRAFAERRARRALARAVKRAGIDAPVHYDEVTASTSTTALDMAARGAPEWTIVAAGHQTGGRGRLGREWVSAPGSSLLFSMVLRPSLPPDRALLLALLAAVAMAAACRETAGAEVRCKWPNDLLLEGRKVGGILSEARVHGRELQHVVIGVGVNLRSVPAGIEDAASLGPVDGGELLTAFLGRFREGYVPGAEALSHLVIREYAPLCATLGRRVRASTIDGRVIEGEAVDLDPNGNLVVAADGARAVVGFGEVQHLR